MNKLIMVKWDPSEHECREDRRERERVGVKCGAN